MWVVFQTNLNISVTDSDIFQTGSDVCDVKAALQDRRFRLYAENAQPQAVMSLEPLTSLTTSSAAQCASRCLQTEHCRSFTIDKQSAPRWCLLYDFVTLASPVQAFGKNYYVMISNSDWLGGAGGGGGQVKSVYITLLLRLLPSSNFPRGTPLQTTRRDPSKSLSSRVIIIMTLNVAMVNFTANYVASWLKHTCLGNGETCVTQPWHAVQSCRYDTEDEIYDSVTSSL